MKFMFEDLEDYAEIMGIPRSHPSWDAFQIIWNMSRSPASLLGEDTEEEENDKAPS